MGLCSGPHLILFIVFVWFFGQYYLPLLLYFVLILLFILVQVFVLVLVFVLVQYWSLFNIGPCSILVLLMVFLDSVSFLGQGQNVISSPQKYGTHNILDTYIWVNSFACHCQAHDCHSQTNN